MAEYMHLVGAEDVSRAGSQMNAAAAEMQRAASAIDSVLERHQRFMDDWLYRFELAMRRQEK